MSVFLKVGYYLTVPSTEKNYESDDHQLVSDQHGRLRKIVSQYQTKEIILYNDGDCLTIVYGDDSYPLDIDILKLYMIGHED